jgi:hypothetical protein
MRSAAPAHLRRLAVFYKTLIKSRLLLADSGVLDGVVS